MAYFPFFMELSGQSGLIVGGGAVAARKVEKLLPYGPRLTVIARHFCPALKENREIIRLCRPFSPQDVENQAFVVAATDDRRVNRQIAELCRQRRIPVNAVDDRESCTFLFPALVRRGTLSVGISTGGASPTAAVWLKEQIADLLPENTEELLAWLDSLRDRIRREIPREADRAGVFRELFARCMAQGAPCSQETVEEILAGAEKEDRP